jgi:dTDP-4-amino-4,6-dideoxygalactose transaminase
VGRVFLSPPDMSVGSREFLLDAFDSNWVAPLGPHVDGFESELATFVDAPAAAALSSGTAALHLALLIAGVGPGDQVIVPTLTFSAPANAVIYTGAALRFVDVESETWNLSPDLLQRAFDDGPLPAAVVAVDLYGQCAQLDVIAELCASRGVTLIEDAAEALGATWRGRSAGTYGRFGVFSFNGNKIMTTSGGGMLVGDVEDVARARYLATQARQAELHYEHTEIGFNYRLSNLLAAIGRAELADLPRKIERRRQINARYRSLLAPVDGLSFMPWDRRGDPNGWLTVALLDPTQIGASPADLCRHLDSLDIEARPAWKPMHLQPVFAEVPTVGGDLARRLFERGVCLPSGSALTHDDVGRVVAGITEFCRARH